MANKIDNVIDAIETSLNTLVGGDPVGPLIAVRRGVVSPVKLTQAPVVGLAPSRIRREGDYWVCDVLVMLCCRAGSGDVDAAITDVLAEVDANIETLIAAGTAGGAIDRPNWDYWYHPTAGELSPVGAMGALRIRVNGPLKIP